MTEIMSEESFVATLEFLSENVHNQWMAGRIAEGWKYGKQRNDILKEHPGLVPYQDLSEEEKEYDRQTVVTTIKCLIDCGFEIKKKK